MKKISILFVVLLTLAIVMGSASGDYYQSSQDGYTHIFNVQVNKGWNLVLFPDASTLEEDIQSGSDVKRENILALWAFDPYGKGYVNALESGWQHEFTPGEYRSQAFVNSAAWIYSDRSGDLTYRRKEVFRVEDNRIKLIEGWNLMAFTPGMEDKTFNDIAGDCTFDKVYVFDSYEQQWAQALESELTVSKISKFSDIGKGIAVKVPETCTLGTAISTPPSLPE